MLDNGKLTVNQACKMASISRPTFYKYVNNGSLSIIKDGKNTYIDASELVRVFPNAQLNDDENIVNRLQGLTTELTHKDELINLLNKQLSEKQQDNEFLKQQLTQANTNFTHFNKLLEDKTQQKTEKKRRRFLGIF